MDAAAGLVKTIESAMQAGIEYMSKHCAGSLMMCLIKGKAVAEACCWCSAVGRIQDSGL